MASLIQNLNSIYDTKLAIKQVIGTQSDVFADYPDLIEAAIEGGGGSGLDWDDVAQAGYIIPAGTISPNGFEIYDVTNYAYADTRGLQPSGSYSISENGNYNVSTYATVNVSVSGGGSTYSIVSGYVFDTMGTTLGYMNDNTTYLSYGFTLDSMTPSVSFGEALTVSGNYDAFTSIGHILGSVEGNGTYNMTGYTPINETSGWSEFNISNVLIEQPNVNVDFNVKLYKDQGLYGFPYDIEYTVTGYTPLVISSMTYSLDGGMIYDSMVYDSTNNVYSVSLNSVSVNVGGMLSPIVKVEYTNGVVKYLNGTVTLSDYGSPANYPGYWNTDTMQQMFYIDNMMGSTPKDITSIVVSPAANITVNFTDQAVTLTRVYSQGSSSNTDLVDQGNGTWMEENVRDGYVPGRVMYEVYSNNTSQSYQVDHYDSATETLYFVIGNQRDTTHQYGEAGWNWLWDTNAKTLSHFIPLPDSSSSSSSSAQTGDSWMFSNSDTAGIMSTDTEEQFTNPNTSMTETATVHTFYNIPLNSGFGQGGADEYVVVNPFTINRNGMDTLYIPQDISVADSDIIDNNYQYDYVQAASFNPMVYQKSPITISCNYQSLPMNATVSVYEVGGTDFFIRVHMDFASA